MAIASIRKNTSIQKSKILIPTPNAIIVVTANILINKLEAPLTDFNAQLVSSPTTSVTKLKSKRVGNCAGVLPAADMAAMTSAPGYVGPTVVEKVLVRFGAVVMKGGGVPILYAGALASDTGRKLVSVAVTSASLEAILKLLGVALWLPADWSVNVVVYCQMMCC